MAISRLLGILALLAGPAAADLFPDCVNGPLANNTVCDASASVSDRAKALVAAFTIEEKLSLTGNTSPGVPRLGLYSYQWWRTLLERLRALVTDNLQRKHYMAWPALPVSTSVLLATSPMQPRSRSP